MQINPHREKISMCPQVFIFGMFFIKVTSVWHCLLYSLIKFANIKS